MAKKPPRSRAGTRRISQARPEGTVRKNFNLPQEVIDRARAALGTSTETETVLRALESAADLAEFRKATDLALAELVGRGGFTDRLASPSETR